MVLAVIAFAGLPNALLLSNFNQEATGALPPAVSVFARVPLKLWRAGPPRGPAARRQQRSPRSGAG